MALTTKQKHTFLKTFPFKVLKPILRELQKKGGIITFGTYNLTESQLEEAISALDLIEKDYKDWLNTGAPKEVHQNLKSSQNLFD